MQWRLMKRAMTAALLAGAFLSQATGTLAGTTGGLSGTVLDADTSAPISGASVTVVSPSQTASTTTDAGGRFQFVSLSPDTYTINVKSEGHADISQAGVAVFADATQQVALRSPKALKVIATARSVAANNLVKSGTTADVYAINAATQDKVSGLGGGGGLNNAYSAIASVPGAYVPLNQNGYYQTVHVRGGDYDQLGYEVDGVPVNRSFDNYPGGTASSLGQQELQVYTGASPANSEGQGLAGYINQVIKTGTSPGFMNLVGAIGTPGFYHKLAYEVGGATPNRLFSYYVGLGGYDNDNFLYVDRNQGPQYTANWGNVFGQTATGAYYMLPVNGYATSGLRERDVVGNVHFGIPHRHDTGRDDVQLLYSNQFLNTAFYDSTNDLGGPAAFAAIGLVPQFYDGLVYNGTVGAALPANFTSNLATYYFPSSSSQRCANVPTGFTNACPINPATGNQYVATVDPNQRDTIFNDQSIVKLQYQKNFGSSAYVRLYGYTFYSDWLQTGPQTSVANFFGPVGPDYELFTHTRGLSGSFVKQFNPQNLVTLQASVTTANSVRNNNRTFYDLFGYGGAQTDLAVLVSSANPLNGQCYDLTGTRQTCNPRIGNASFVHFGDRTAPVIAPGTVCGGAPCQYEVVENGLSGLYNSVKPTFTSYSLVDEFRPNDRLLLNLGLRIDQFKFQGSDTSGPVRDFWFAAYNNDNCVDPVTGAPINKANIAGGTSVTTPCSAISSPSGAPYKAANLVNASGQVQQYSVFQPRISGTYTLNPETVVRFSAGRYAQPPNTAYEQYNAQQQDTADLLGSRFYKFGFNTPGHAVRPPTSDNFDLSFEKRIHGTDLTFKLTPFYRHTQDQIQNFFLDQKTGFVSGLNVGSLSARGIEFQAQKGDFSKNGLAGLLSFTYTYTTIKYGALPNGTTILSQTNQDILNYNAYTSFCSTNPNDSRCKGGTTSTGVAAAPCYSTTGAAINNAALCVAGTVANPYWNAPAQGLIDPSQSFQAFDIFPGGINSSYDAYNTPYVLSAVLNFKHDKLAITPSFQYAAGNRYGAPETTQGIAPETCTGILAPALDPQRYPYGGNGNAYDAGTCGTLAGSIPDPLTGHFDAPGEFRNPAQFVANLQLSYQASERVSFVATLANVINRCWGGTGPGTAALNDSNTCSYGILGSGGGALNYFGNAYNPGSAAYTSAPGFLKYPYEPSFGSVNVNGSSVKQPFQVYVEARIKL